MKVVLNKCYGGFGVSGACLWELIRRKAKCVEAYPIDKYYGADNAYFADKWKARRDEDIARLREMNAREKKTPDAEFQKTLPPGWLVGMFGGQLYDLNAGVVWSLNDKHDEVTRTDPDLIELVERDGGAWASGQLSELRVVEIPDGVDWEIDEYDGVESIDEVHRSWG